MDGLEPAAGMVLFGERPRSDLKFLLGLLLGCRLLEFPELELGRREKLELEVPGLGGRGNLEPELFGDRLGKVGYFLGSVDDERGRDLVNCCRLSGGG